MLKLFLKVLAGFYFLGFLLHMADILDLRLKFSEMDNLQKIWILLLLIFDLLVAAGLWINKWWGQVLFVVIALTQIIIYSMFIEFMGKQLLLIYFHSATLFVYFSFAIQNRLTRFDT